MRLRTRASLGLLALGLVVLAWWGSPWLARRLVFTGPAPEQRARAETADVTTLQAHVRSALGSLGLRADQLQERDERPQQDPDGSWLASHERWRLPTESEPAALARRIEALVSSADPQAEIYLVEQQTHEVQLRFYAGSRLAAVLDLEPSLGPWPRLSTDQQPLLALVVYGVDKDPHGVRQLMDRGQPMALALSPYSPFSLRLSRDALLTHAEVLALAEPDVTLAEALEAVPHASGVLITGSFEGTPEQQARALRDADVYVLDAVEGGLSAQWLRAFQEAGVPYVHSIASSAETAETVRRRYRHLAASSGAAVVVTEAGTMASAEVEQLALAAARGYRLAFPAEIVEALRR